MSGTDFGSLFRLRPRHESARLFGGLRGGSGHDRRTGCVSAWRKKAPRAKPRVALVFLANSAEREIWPYPGFDCARRQQEIVELLGGRLPAGRVRPGRSSPSPATCRRRSP